MKKPEFPKPRLIYEDFLPEQDIMSNYRIKKVTLNDNKVRYYPQRKVLHFFWIDVKAYNFSNFIFDLDDTHYETFEQAISEIKSDIDYRKRVNPKIKVEILSLTEQP